MCIYDMKKHVLQNTASFFSPSVLFKLFTIINQYIYKAIFLRNSINQWTVFSSHIQNRSKILVCCWCCCCCYCFFLHIFINYFQIIKLISFYILIVEYWVIAFQTTFNLIFHVAALAFCICVCLTMAKNT